MGFYCFNTLTGLCLISAFLVVTSKNPIHSVFFLVFLFFNTAGLLILLGVEFLAMLFLIVYVGAVAVLFLFVMMMLNIKIS
jgi:NADH-quinone oxidoreductase subunit J